MVKRTLILSVVLFLLSNILAWGGVGAWRSHFSYHNATQCAVVHDKVYVVSNGSLFSYSPDDEFVECYDKSNILSDQGIRHIGVCEKTNTLIVIYNNANIDLIRPNGEVINVTDYVNETSLDPVINDLRIINGKAYLSTNFGVTVLDIEKTEFSNTYISNEVTYSSVELDGFIFAARGDGLYRGDLRVNLLDTANWELLNSEVFAELEVFEQRLMGVKSKIAVCDISLTDGSAKNFRTGTFNFIHCSNGTFVAGTKNDVYVYTTPEACRQFTFDSEISSFAVDGDTYWSCNGTKGLNGYTYDKESKSLTKTVTEIFPNSPIRNYCQYLSVVGDDRLLVAGGCLNYFGDTFYNGTLMMYEDGEWSSFEEEGITKRTAGHYKNMTSIVQDPLDPTHHFASSFGQGIYEFRNMKFVRQYTHKAKSGLAEVVASPLESVVPNSYQYTRICRLHYDKQGNLWISNSHAESPLKVLKPDSTFVNLYYEELEKLPTITEVLFDSHDRVWVVSMRAPSKLFCIDLNGTLEDTSDDRVKVFNQYFIDQDGGSVEVYYINDIAEDHNGDIWVMTDKGPYVLYETERVFEENYHFTKIKVPRNDGTNYADYLLDGAYTTCVEIDAANRKWIGTLNSGLYLVGADGIESIHRFTKDNSPLPSNTIESLVLNHKSGELFIGTDKGLVSYTTDATQGEESYIEENVYAYPNPVVSYYDGLITIVGLKANSHVKIINTAGRLVAEGTSLGGTFTWDGRTAQGQRVSTGVYYVLGSDEEGNEGIVTKVLFIK